MLEYAAERYPHIERHVSVQASATTKRRLTFIIAIWTLPAWYCRGVVDSSGETAGTGHTCTTGRRWAACIASEGRCYLSYLTGESPNTSSVFWPVSCAGQQTPQQLESRLNRSADRPLSGRRKTQVIRRQVKGVIPVASAITRWKNQPVSIPWNCCRS